MGSKNFSTEEAERLKELAARGLSKTEVAGAMGRSYWAVMRHSKRLGIAFAARETAPSKQVARPDLAETRAQRRTLEDRLIQEFARRGWSQGIAAVELDLDFSALSRHSKRLGVSWTHSHGRSVRGSAVSGVAELRHIRNRLQRLRRPSSGRSGH
jgi:hypothetical protein